MTGKEVRIWPGNSAFLRDIRWPVVISRPEFEWENNVNFFSLFLVFCIWRQINRDLQISLPASANVNISVADHDLSAP
jgi:hypothetical protein